jgi:hypothetical protein
VPPAEDLHAGYFMKIKQTFKQQLVMRAAWQGQDLGFFSAGFLRFLRVPVPGSVFPVSG